MNKHEKEEIKKLRKKGLGYKRIAVILGLSHNTVKSYCRREKLKKETIKKHDGCLLCNEKLIQKVGKKQKKFCSDICRMKWWNTHLNQVKRKSYSTHECLMCGETFKSYANKTRKYCSHRCYINFRFGDNNNE